MAGSRPKNVKICLKLSKILGGNCTPLSLCIFRPYGTSIVFYVSSSFRCNYLVITGELSTDICHTSRNIRQNIGLDLQPVCSHLSHRPCHHVLGCKQYQLIRAPNIFKFHALRVFRNNIQANIARFLKIRICCLIKVSLIVFSPRLDGRDDETNDFTLVEDQG